MALARRVEKIKTVIPNGPWFLPNARTHSDPVTPVAGSVAAQRVDGGVDARGEAVAVGLRAPDESRALEEEQ